MRKVIYLEGGSGAQLIIERVRQVYKLSVELPADQDVAYMDRDDLAKLHEEIGIALNPIGCTCDGHRHSGGKGGCYFGGTLVPACSCRYNNEP